MMKIAGWWFMMVVVVVDDGDENEYLKWNAHGSQLFEEGDVW